MNCFKFCSSVRADRSRAIVVFLLTRICFHRYRLSLVYLVFLLLRTTTQIKTLFVNRRRNGGNRDGKKPPRRRKQRKNDRKLALRSVKKSNSSNFKRNARRSVNVPIPDARLKLQDARLKILRNKNLITKNRSPLIIGKGALVDARLKIEAHKLVVISCQKSLAVHYFPSELISVSILQKQKKLERKKPSGITTIGGDGIIERRINANTVNNEIHVEYEDEDMDLEFESN